MAKLENSLHQVGQHVWLAGTTNFPLLHHLIKDPKELYPDHTGETTWVLPVVSKRIAKFKRTLATEPPIPLGTPDPYEPGKRQ